MRKFCFVVLFFHSLISKAESSVATDTLILTPQKVVNRILADGYGYKLIQSERIVESLDYYTNKGVFDWEFEATASYEEQNVQPIDTFENEQEKVFNFQTGIRKYLGFGSTVSAQYSRLSQNRKLNAFLSGTNSSLPISTTDWVHLSLKQNLLNNFAGGARDRNFEVQKLQEQFRDQDKTLKTEKLLLDGLDNFWKAYTAQGQLQSSIATRQRYEKLVKTARNKQAMGYAAPGELAQIEAELEEKNQDVKEKSYSYIESVNSLFTLLGVETPEKLKLDIDGEEIPPLPLFPDIPTENVREVRMQAQQLESSRIQQKIVASEQRPILDLEAKMSYRGADENADEAFTKLESLDSPTYYVGLTFQTQLGSSTRAGERQVAQAQVQKQRAQFELTQLQVKNQILNVKNQVSAQYQIASSAKVSVEKRNSALRQIESAYRQGRLEVDQVIESYNKLLAAQTKLTTSIGNYHYYRNLLAKLSGSLLQNYKSSEQKSIEATR